MNRWLFFFKGEITLIATVWATLAITVWYNLVYFGMDKPSFSLMSCLWTAPILTCHSRESTVVEMFHVVWHQRMSHCLLLMPRHQHAQNTGARINSCGYLYILCLYLIYREMCVLVLLLRVRWEYQHDKFSVHFDYRARAGSRGLA